MTNGQKSDSGIKAGARREAMVESALEERRISMKTAEGHAGSVPRGNPVREDENVGRRRAEYERVLGH